MRTLSITTAWNETSAFVARDGGTLFVVAFAFLALPSVAFQFFVQPGPAPDPATVGFALVGVLVVVFLSLWGSLTLSLLALSLERVVGAALRRALGRLPALLGTMLILILGLLVLLLPVILLIAPHLRDPSPLLALPLLLIVIAMVALWVRLILMTPVAAAEPVGPVRILARSWELTRGRFWKLLGFVLLLLLVFTVISMVVGVVGGLIAYAIAGLPKPGSAAMLIVQLLSGLINAAWGMILAVFLARIYAQLAGDEAGLGTIFE
jgi:hypothetical protein